VTVEGALLVWGGGTGRGLEGGKKIKKGMALGEKCSGGKRRWLGVKLGVTALSTCPGACNLRKGGKKGKFNACSEKTMREPRVKGVEGQKPLTKR